MDTNGSLEIVVNSNESRDIVGSANGSLGITANSSESRDFVVDAKEVLGRAISVA